MKLYDSETKTGNELRSFLGELEKLSMQTEIMEVNSCLINLFTVSGIDESGVSGFLHSKGSSKKRMKIPMDTMRDCLGADDTLLDELAVRNGHHSPQILVNIGDLWFFVADWAMNTLAQRGGCVKSKAFLCKEGAARFHRDGFLEACMYYQPSAVTLLYRKAGKTKKLFSAFTPKYGYVDQYKLVKGILSNMESSLGQAKMMKWEVTHIFTDACIEFPEKGASLAKKYDLPDKVMPGIHIHTSDVGESCFMVTGTIRIGTEYIHIPECIARIEHERNNEKALMGLVMERITPCFEEIGNRLANLSHIRIKDPDLTIQEVFDACGFKRSTCIGSRKSDFILKDQLLGRFTEDCTAYDIVKLFTEIPGSQEISGSGYRSLDMARSAAANAIFYPFEN